MKIKTLIKTSLWVVMAIIFINCANEDTTENDNQKQQTEPGVATTFTGSQSQDNSMVRTRTTATHEFHSPAKVFWEATDRIFVKDISGNWQQSEPAKFRPRTPIDYSRALFTFTSNNFDTKPEVRYTNGSDGNTVVIANQQSQTSPGVFNHLGASGDCGTATASGDGNNYEFTLNHKAAYLCLYPRFTNAEVCPNMRLEKITITSTGVPLAGSFDFADGEIKDKPAKANASTEIVLNTNSAVMSTTTSDANCYYVVLRPSSSALTLNVVYTIKDPTTNVTLDVSKTITQTFEGGKIYDYTAQLDKDIEHLSPVYYTWDAVNSYWNAPGAVQPKVRDTYGSGNPQVGDPYNRWFNTAAGPNTATNSAAGMPNANLIYWYVRHGEPHWDGEKPWTAMGHLYKGVSWYLRKTVIATKHGHAGDPGYLDRVSPDGYDRRVHTPGTFPTGIAYHLYNEGSGVIKQYAPSASEMADYFFIPPLGYYNGNRLAEIGRAGTYWSSNSQGLGYHITVGFGTQFLNRVDYCGQQLGFPQWDFK